MPDDALESLLVEPRRSGLFLDYDGTLAEIVDNPAAARPLEGVVETLRGLAGKLGLVAVVSGRSAAQLLEWLGPDVEIWGLYGAQRTERGSVVLSEDVAAYEGVMREVVAEARAAVGALDLEGVLVEDKTVMVGLHHRAATDPGAGSALERIARDLAQRHHLTIGAFHMAYELRPPVELSKASVLLKRARDMELRAAAFAGDDVVDLPAFDALDDLARDGLHAIRIAVTSPDTPTALVERADVTVDGPRGMLEVLRRLEATRAR